MAWFADGRLSPCYNMVDRHAIKNPDSVNSPPYFFRC
jgi:hypothetical protein